MSSTSNAQDLLVNVFRPTYRWDSTTGFVPSLVVSNVTEVIAGSVKTDKLAVSDARGNTYIGSDAGALLTNETTRENTAIGYSAMSGAINSSNNVSIGSFNFFELTNGVSNVGIGADTLITGTGQKNILIGTNNTIGDGSGNIIIGNDLSLGNISKRFQLGTLLYGDLSSGFVGINTSAPAAALDISGIVVFRNKVGFQNPDPTYSLDVAGSVYASEQFIGSNGTMVNPLFTFEDASGTGMYIPASGAGYGVGAFGITVNRSPAAVFSSNAVNFYQNLDVSGTFSACNVNIGAFSVTNGTVAAPSVTFTNDVSTGLYLAASNRLGVVTGGVRRIDILSNGDISLGHLLARDISFSGRIVGADAASCNIIGGVVLQNGYVTTTGTSSSSNLVVSGFIRNSEPATQIDISGGNISNSLTTRSSNFIGTSTASNSIGGVTLSNTNISYAGTITGSTANTSNDIGGVTLSNTNISYAGTITGSTANTSNRIGGVTLSNGNVNASTISNSGTTTSDKFRAGVGSSSFPTYAFTSDPSSGMTLSVPGTLRFTTGSILTACTLSNGMFGIGISAPSNALDVNGTASASNALVSGYLRNALTPTTWDISGGNISNSNSIQTGNPVDKNLYATIEIGKGYLYDFTGTAGTPAMSFQYVNGGYRHFVRTRHLNNAGNGNGIDFFLNTNGASTGSTAPRTGNVHVMSITATGVGIGTELPSAWLDVSGRARIVQDGSTSLTSWGLNNQADTLILQHTGSYSTAADRGKSASILFANATSNYPQARIASEMLGVTAGSYGASLLFQTNSQGSGLTERMRIHSNGFVGIGMSAPVSAVDVSSPSDGDGKAVIQVKNSSTGQGIVRVIGSNQANTTGLELFHTGSYGGLYLPAGISNLSFWAGGQRRMDIVNGNVGIANATPTATLDLAATGAWIAVNRNGNIPFVSDVSMIVEGGNGVGLYFQKGTNNNFCGISIKTLCNNVLAERFRVDANTGRIGIGTTAPSSLLHIQKSTNYDGGNSTDGTPYGIYFSAANNSDSARVLAVDRNTAGGAWKTELAFYTKYDVTSTERLRLSGEGNLGVGTSNPGYRLDVTSGATDTAAINVSTWYRASSTAMLCAGSINRANNIYNWSNATPAIDTNLLSLVASNASTGGYFTILKSGIWAISVVAQGQGTDAQLGIDASSGTSLNGFTGTNTLAKVVGFNGSVSFTGYLSSNSSMYYKIVGINCEATSKSTKLFISFIQELPNISPTFPPP